MSRITSTFKMTCPRCEQDKLFVTPMKLSNPLAMHKQCSACGQRFEPEPGFYYGAMFISYIFLGFTSLGLVGTMVFGFGLSIEIAFTVLLVVLALIFFWNLRFARSIYIHLVIKPQRELKAKESKE